MNYVREGLKDKRAGKQWHRTTSRTLQDMHHRCSVRPATEEFNLSASIDRPDVTAAEFIRTYQTRSFPGGELSRLEEATKRASDAPKTHKRAPPILDPDGKDVYLKNFADFYGYRGNDARVYYLSPLGVCNVLGASKSRCTAKYLSLIHISEPTRPY